MKNIFVSYKFSDRTVAHNVKSLLQNGGKPIRGSFKFVENDVSALGPRAIDNEIRRVMTTCDTVLFIVGDDSHNSPWINREAQLATSLGLQLLAMRLPGSNSGIPNELKGRYVEEINWSGQELAAAL